MKKNLPASLDREVELALFKRATGCQVKEETYSLERDPESGESRMVLTKQVVKHSPPDLAAQKFWLSCRMGEAWGKETAGAGEQGVVMIPEVADCE